MSPLTTAAEDEFRTRLSVEAGTSNKAFSTHEERTLRVMLSDERQCLSELDSKIRQLVSIPTSLYEQRENCIGRIDRYSVALSPQKHLPSEILAKIFLYTMVHDRAVLPIGYTDSPWLLLKVCSRWRQVALVEHRLWSHLDVRGTKTSSVRRMVTMWLPQVWTDAYTFPISLTLKAFDEDLDLHDLLSPYSLRLRSISLNATLKVISTFLFGPPVTFGNLESLDLDFPWRSQVQDMSLAGPADFPELKRIKIRDPKGVFLGCFTIPQFPWFQITHVTLSMRGLAYMNFKHIASQCHNLVSLELTLYNNLNPFADPTFSVSAVELHLPRLQFLTVLVEGKPRDLDILGYFRLPSMKQFTVEVMNWMGINNWNQSFFHNMLHLSGFRLTSLYLGSFNNIPFEVLLSELTHLTNLVVSILTPVPGVIFDMMIRGELLGMLERIECYTVSPIAFLRLLEYQCENLSSGQYRGLSVANVVYKPPKDTDEIQEFRGLYCRLGPILEAGGKEVLLTECDDF